jgi:DNA-binding NarL/FixJ family response regulator
MAWRGGERHEQQEEQPDEARHDIMPAWIASPAMKKRILIADDHAFVSWGIAKALMTLDEVEIVGTATNGIDAIVEIRKTKPDCAVLDYNMPGANGLEVFLESKRWSPATRFILLTGTASAATVRTLVDAGIHGVSLKDDSEVEILELVRQVCAGRSVIGASVKRLLKAATDSVALTDREHAILQALARGHTNASAAESLGISPKTVDSHRTSLMRKFAVNSTASLLLAAVRAGLLDPNSIR